VLAKKDGLTADDVSVVNTLGKALAILKDEPIPSTKMTIEGFGSNQGGSFPASVFYADGLPNATIDGKTVTARDGLKAWAEEVLTAAGIDIGTTKKAKEPTPEDIAREERLAKLIKGN
jgi:hypothetical protein